MSVGTCVCTGIHTTRANNFSIHKTHSHHIHAHTHKHTHTYTPTHTRHTHTPTHTSHTTRNVENVKEELDYPNEWYYDAETEDLFYFHNATGV